MAKFLRLVNGLPRMIDESSSTSIYDQTIEYVASGPGAGQAVGPVTAGTAITLPSSQTYTSHELEVYLNGQRLDDVFDFTFTSSTQITMTFDIAVGDILRFRIDRSA